MQRTFTADEKDLAFDLWKSGVGFSEIARILDADRRASRDVIDTNLTRLAQDTPFPTQIAGTGAIRASLSWGDRPDVDLHAFEPNGSHVCYRNFTGQDGTLGADDTKLLLRENYF